MTNAPFTRGVNLTQWFEVPSVAALDTNKFTKQTFINIKSLGADMVRLPIHFEHLSSGNPKYQIDEKAFTLLDTVCSWCEELGLYLIIDNHSFYTHDALFADIEHRLTNIWIQLANRYKQRSEKIIYEIYNEPHKCTSETWSHIQRRILTVIRTIDSTHTVVVGGVDYNAYTALNDLPLYNDDNLIYTFHFYNPFLFTHQGACWAEPSLVPLAGMPFPFDKNRMPSCPKEFEGTNWEQGISSYEHDADVNTLREQLAIPAAWAKENNVAIWCGEFGSLKTNAATEDRVRWYKTVCSLFNEFNIPWTCWDYFGGFGIFKKESANKFPQDLERAVVEAMGFTVPN